MTYTLEQAINRAFDLCNLEGEDTEIWNHMYKYKAVRDLSADEQENVYNQLAKRLGF